MRYWKFLRSGAISPFTGRTWTLGEWTETVVPAACRTGFHACRLGDLPYWLTDELWDVELGPPVLESGHKVVASRARLLSRVEAWTPGTAHELAVACAARTAGHAAAELSEHGLGEQADRLTEAVTREPPAAWAETARDCEERAASRRLRQAARLCGYVADSAEALEVYPPAVLAYIAARAANQRSSAESEDPYTAERVWQAGWLSARLGLA